MNAFTITTREIHAWARKVEGFPEKMQGIAAEAVADANVIVRRELDRRMTSSRPVRRGLFLESGAGAGELGMRSGQSAASITARVYRIRDVYEGAVGSASKTVVATDQGATIVPKNARALTLPTVNALTPTGAIKNEFAGLSSLRQLSGSKKLFIWKGGDSFKGQSLDGAFLARLEGRAPRGAVLGTHHGRVAGRVRGRRIVSGVRLVLYFMLKLRTRIPKREYFKATGETVAPQIVQRTDARVAVEVRDLASGGAA